MARRSGQVGYEEVKGDQFHAYFGLTCWDGRKGHTRAFQFALSRAPVPFPNWSVSGNGRKSSSESGSG